MAPKMTRIVQFVFIHILQGQATRCPAEAGAVWTWLGSTVPLLWFAPSSQISSSNLAEEKTLVIPPIIAQVPRGQELLQPTSWTSSSSLFPGNLIFLLLVVTPFAALSLQSARHSDQSVQGPGSPDDNWKAEKLRILMYI